MIFFWNISRNIQNMNNFMFELWIYINTMIFREYTIEIKNLLLLHMHKHTGHLKKYLH